jgi:hypothetical protein
MGCVPLKKTSVSARKGQYLLVHTEIFKIYDFFQISLIQYRFRLRDFRNIRNRIYTQNKLPPWLY